MEFRLATRRHRIRKNSNQELLPHLEIVIGTGKFIVDERQPEEVEHRELVENT